MPLAYSTYDCPANINTGNTHLVFEKVCYEFVLNRKEYWDGARHDCNNRGGDLALVKSYDVQYYLQTTLQKLNVGNKAVWIGLNDRHHEGHFVWVDGSPLTYSHWAVHEGNGFLRLTQDCAQIHMGDHGLWHDRECHLWPNKFSYICQFPTVETVHTVKPKIPTTTRSSTRSATVQTKMASTTKPSTATFPTTTTTLSSATMSKPKTEYPSPTTIFHQYPTTTELPKQEYPITTTHLPKQEYPITSTHLSEKEYPVTTEHLSEREYPITTEHLPEREYPITTKLPDREYPISTTPEPDREYPVTTKYLPDREFPIRSTLLPEREYPITTPQLLDREYPTTTTSLPDKETKTKLMPIQEYPATTAMKRISSNKDSGNGHFLTPAP
ncbi:soluble scavenger receptor cysteine-rich domain-containing protein SSC5D-like [Mytilus californianus]|uniref:soluble scavenger receptor cysteine-rich domain-containing protein SSC5D-like n=1 Tax=Mytilus californianus TaxID=6549 RepID=UPI002246AEEA|nr:soluble scavenger receptor cysteine-rich domain-containing protein SSC5D-like [Mytilus californianus]